MTLREEILIRNLNDGRYDGIVGEPFIDEHNYRFTYAIERGIPCKYEEIPTKALFCGKDASIKYHSKQKVEMYTTVEEKLKFLQEHGPEMKDRDVRIYSTCYTMAKEKASNSASSKFPLEEQIILKFLRGLDEPVGKAFYDEHLNIVCYWVIDGVPCKLISKPIHSSYHGKETPVAYTPSRIVKKYHTDSKKLLFIMEYGHYMSYEIFQNYSKNSGIAKALPDPLYFLNKAPEPVESTQKNEFDLHLLSRLHAGKLDGPVGTPCDNGYGSMIWYCIEGGTIKRFKRGPIKRVFDGDENEKIIPDWKLDSELKTEEEELNFLRRSGRHMKDPEVIAYSNKYWDNHRNKKK